MVAKPHAWPSPHPKKPATHHHKTTTATITRHPPAGACNNISALRISKLNLSNEQKKFEYPFGSSHKKQQTENESNTSNSLEQQLEKIVADGGEKINGRELTELIIGRLALTGFLSGVGVCLLTGKTLLDQAALWPDNVVLIAIAVVASCITVHKEDEKMISVRFLPLFTSMKIERRLGRVAIVGFAVALFLEGIALFLSKLH